MKKSPHSNMTLFNHPQPTFDKKSQSGFTLVEVLVATIILFSSIATVSLIYKGAYLSSVKSNSHVTLSGVIPVVLSNIRENIRSQGNTELTELSGKERAWGVAYDWDALQVEFKAPPDIFDPDKGTMLVSPKKYKLWEVNLKLTYMLASRNYKYNELSWNDK